MTVYLTLLGRYALTLGAVAAAALLAFILWKQEAQTRWTRDGRVRADVVQIAPDVSGPVASVAVKRQPVGQSGRCALFHRSALAEAGGQ